MLEMDVNVGGNEAEGEQEVLETKVPQVDIQGNASKDSETAMVIVSSAVIRRSTVSWKLHLHEEGISQVDLGVTQPHDSRGDRPHTH
ncbi:hypothetical protein OESDEN_00524 [Oesophagostomum dentatum]|uniref:Uncharacterized protein n=1 Tax=Oesophagostomum dentatum TaxID=61180 RepID=A0A0B1TPL0_OESDE|nr:hypothetical protein OESDEN_00524 [Oesophagostomum dentatum]